MDCCCVKKSNMKKLNVEKKPVFFLKEEIFVSFISLHITTEQIKNHGFSIKVRDFWVRISEPLWRFFKEIQIYPQ